VRSQTVKKEIEWHCTTTSQVVDIAQLSTARSEYN